MVQENTQEDAVSSSTAGITSTTKPSMNDRNPAGDGKTSYPTETVAAVTIAVLAVVIVLTMVLVFRALRKRQRARRGEQFGERHIPTITTGVMGTGGAAYANSLNTVPVQGPVRWESINPSSAEGSQSTQQDGVR